MTVEKVAIITEPLAISVYNNTPVVTVEDLNTGSITVVDGSPIVKIQSNQPTKVIVSSGIGNSYDVDTVLGMLSERVNDAALNSTLMTDISHIRDLWTRVGNQIILTSVDGTNIQNAATLYTDTQIQNTVADLNVVDGRVDLAMSNILQEAARIDLNITNLGIANGNISLAEARIALTENSITSTVSRLDSLDGPTGAVSQLQSSIDQTASNLDLNVIATQQNSQDIITNAAGLAITSADLALYVSELDTVQAGLNAAQIELTATSITSSVNQSLLGTQGYRLTATETMLANKWGVEISETGGGVNYITGIGLFLHPSWVTAHTYVIDDHIYFFNSGTGQVYKCILGHISSTANNPAGVDGATYWIVSTGKKSSFVIQADEFKVITPDDTVTTLLTLDGNALSLAVPIQSNDYVAGVSGYRIDPISNLAEFNDFTLSADRITTGYLDAARIAADTITATMIDVVSLSAINADIGTVTAGRVQSANNKRFMNLDATGAERFLQVQDDSGVDAFWVKADGSGYIKSGFLSAYTSQTFTSSGTFTVPTGVQRVFVDAVSGGGGGAGGGSTSPYGGGGGGGAGGLGIEGFYVEVTPGQEISITIGNGGQGAASGGPYEGAYGSAGGSTSFGSSLTVTGSPGGGLGGYANAYLGGQVKVAASDSGNGGRGGGVPSGQVDSLSAQAGGDSFRFSGGVTYGGEGGGGGGASLLSNGGAGGRVYPNNNSGVTPSGYGGGGGGGSVGTGSSTAGGNGAPGWLRVYW